jgi:exopolysaccharide biosynthesis polyprenyl glycosylphosphotransferase
MTTDTQITQTHLKPDTSQEWGLSSGRYFSIPREGIHVCERKLLLGLVDLLIINAALLLALYARSQVEVSLAIVWNHLYWFTTLSAIWLVVGVLFVVYDLSKASNIAASVKSAASAALVTSLVYICIPFLTPILPTRRLEIFYYLLFPILGVSFWRIVYARVFVLPGFHRRALVIGAGWAGGTLASTILSFSGGHRNPYQGVGYRIIGFVDDDPGKQGRQIEGVPVLGTRKDLVELVHREKPDDLILAITHSGTIHADLFQAIIDCRAMGTSITTMQAFYERLTGQVPVEHAGRNLEVILPLNHCGKDRLYLAVRRALDILAGASGCLVVGALIPILRLANRVYSPGPLFYRQERVGKSGATFQLVKFRSMIIDAEAGTGAVWAKEGDQRITPIGRLLRKTRLDELPQFWNVLKGEMTLIGPRPERPEFVARLGKKIPFYRVRHAVKPGITGWAQVRLEYGASVEDSFLKLRHDLFYIKNQGLYLDLLVLLKTIQVVVHFRGR